ncbi:MAG TPA: MAPEG family protein [Steroidobacteraceae bacterium]|nr:MAPEG family protein [Steroidobacteraceae bacterium]
MSIVWPAFALVALTLAVVFRLARQRFAAARAGRVDPRYYKVFRGEGEPPDVAATARNLTNLYEMPTLFYAGIAIAFAAGRGGVLLVALAWAYVALRYVHSAIHLTTNKVIWRFRAFAASMFVLLAFWGALGWQLATGTGLAAAGP